MARPAATVFGQDAYPDLYARAAALLHLLARNHALVERNKRTAWAAARVFLEVNGQPLSEHLDVDAAEELALEAAQGAQEVPEIAADPRRFGPT